MSRTIAALLGTALLALAAFAGPAHAASKPVDDTCNQVSPLASPCIGADKLAQGGAAECRRVAADDQCVMPAGEDDLAADRAAYAGSWVHRAAQFQYAIGSALPLNDAQWVGTHNSFNSFGDGETISHLDSNQQLTLSQQLDIDVRALEIDVHWVPSAENGGADSVVVCHGQGPSEENFGCTNEPLLADVLPEITTWLNAHSDQVVLLYLEDNLDAAPGYAETIKQLEAKLRRPDGSSLIYHPDLAQKTAAGCVDLPLDRSRDDVLAAGAQVMLVGNCRSGWASDVFGWDDNHVESGSTPGYKAFPTCDATYNRSVYDAKLVRYFEDSTWVSATVGTDSPSSEQAGRLTPDRVAAMTACGVNLFGFDQLLPNDGRLEATIWSWAKDQPDPSAGACTVQGADGRWSAHRCTGALPAACRTASGGWFATKSPVVVSRAESVCRVRGGDFAMPRSGYENSLLRTAAGDRTVWLDHSVTS